jgi:hypothetical protein
MISCVPNLYIFLEINSWSTALETSCLFCIVVYSCSEIHVARKIMMSSRYSRTNYNCKRSACVSFYNGFIDQILEC